MKSMRAIALSALFLCAFAVRADTYVPPWPDDPSAAKLTIIDRSTGLMFVCHFISITNIVHSPLQKETIIVINGCPIVTFEAQPRERPEKPAPEPVLGE